MPNYEEIVAQGVPINVLLGNTKYEDIPHELLELYFTPDTTEQDIADAVSAHNTSNTAHTDIRNAIPTKTSDLTNDSNYATVSQIPTNNNQLTNGARYITGITSTDVTNALGYTPYNSTNPNGYTSNIGTVTSVNNVSPVSGNVSLPVATFYWGE